MFVAFRIEVWNLYRLMFVYLVRTCTVTLVAYATCCLAMGCPSIAPEMLPSDRYPWQRTSN